jgi:4-amino-4-deoxy-L-arabinose transferase-like glycosyltransferase
MLFFTVSGNILWTYVLPGIPAFALLVAEFWRPDADRVMSRIGAAFGTACGWF